MLIVILMLSPGPRVIGKLGVIEINVNPGVSIDAEDTWWLEQQSWFLGVTVSVNCDPPLTEREFPPP